MENNETNRNKSWDYKFEYFSDGEHEVSIENSIQDLRRGVCNFQENKYNLMKPEQIKDEKNLFIKFQFNEKSDGIYVIRFEDHDGKYIDLLMLLSNLYIVGFKSEKYGTYLFKEFSKLKDSLEKDERFGKITEGKAKSGYDDLYQIFCDKDGQAQDKDAIKISYFTLINAVNTLSKFDFSGGSLKSEHAQAALVFITITAEAIRFKTVQDNISWKFNDKDCPYKVTSTEKAKFKAWKTMSVADNQDILVKIN